MIYICTDEDLGAVYREYYEIPPCIRSYITERIYEIKILPYRYCCFLLLSVVYQYLIGLLDRGGGKTYSSASLEFRSIYISIVLFQGAYVWIKFRDVAPESEQHPPRGLYRKSKVNESGVTVYYGNYEPRFKPPRCNYISVGSYEEEEDAKAIYQILAFYYSKKDIQGELPLLGDSTYPIPPMTEEERRLDPENKKEWVKGKAKAVLEEYKGVMMDSIFIDCLMKSQPTEDFVNPVPLLSECPDAGAAFGGMEPSGGVQAEAHPFLGNQAGDDEGGAVQSAPLGNSIPNGGPGTQEVQHHMGSVTLGGHVVGDASHSTLPELSMSSVPEPATNIPAIGAAISREQPLEFQPSEIQLYHRSWQENQVNNSAINVIPDDLSLRRQVKELQRQVQSQKLRNEQLESRISASELVSQQLESRFLQFQQQQQLQQLRSEQRQQLRNEQLESQISALEGEVEHLRSTEHARKRSCSGSHSQN